MSLLIDTPLTVELSGVSVTMTARKAARCYVEHWSSKREDDDTITVDGLLANHGECIARSAALWDDSIFVLNEYHRRRDTLRWRDIANELPDEGQEIEYIFVGPRTVARPRKYEPSMNALIWLWRPAQTIQEKKS